MRKKLIIITVMCFILAFSCSCNLNGKKQYYSEKENYISITGTITEIKYNEDSTALYISFSDLSSVLDDVSFKIVGDNLQIVQNNGIDSKLRTGDKINFITAPKYFGDGYVMPIVAISVNGENLLDFEEGYANLLKWLS